MYQKERKKKLSKQNLNFFFETPKVYKNIQVYQQFKFN